ncbi:MAG: RNA 2',3'-cyclic phosphodiesterase, partial [Methanomassiliicoccaceae archaeon]|nr:RNA 2',3'-cyclic phosphodiesterase [Methanomassiliicoccaceae archaeon]
MRLFIAINLSDAARSRLAALQDELRSGAKRGNFTKRENLHLTLAFLGECDDAQANAAKAAMHGVNFEEFTMMIDRIGNFRNYGSGLTWWAGVRSSEPLKEVQRSLAERLTGRGIKADDRPYTAHITIGRDVVTKKEPRIIEPFEEKVSAMDLMRSERIYGKLTYTS